MKSLQLVVILAITFILFCGGKFKNAKDLAIPPIGSSIIYGNIKGMMAHQSYILQFMDSKTEKVYKFCGKCGTIKGGKEEPFAVVIPPGSYEIYGYMNSVGGAGTSFHWWLTSDGYKKMGPTPKIYIKAPNYKPFERDKIEIPANKVIYIGEWEPFSDYPVVTNNKEANDAEVKTKFPKLQIEDAISIVPIISSGKDSE